MMINLEADIQNANTITRSINKDIEPCAHTRKNKASAHSWLSIKQKRGPTIKKRLKHQEPPKHGAANSMIFIDSGTMQKQQETTGFIWLREQSLRHNKLTSNDPNNLDSNRTIYQQAVSCLETLPTSRSSLFIHASLCLNWWESCTSVELTLQVDAVTHIQDHQVA